MIFNFSPANAQPVFSPGSPAPWDSLDVEPGAVIKDGNIFKMWYTGSDNKKHRIGYAVSKDGVKWERNDEIVFDRGEEDAWDSFSAAYPCVIKDGNVFKMWYTGSSGKILSIGYAESKDGIKWERRKSPVFEPAEDDVWDGFSVMYPMVIKSENKYMLWYTGSAGISYKIWTAVSDDGIECKRLENKPIDLGRVHSFHPWVIKEQGQGVKSMLFTDKPAPASSKQGGQEIKYKMWYSVKETPKSAFHIFSAESKDGVKWNIKGEALKPDMGWDIKEVFKPVVLHDGRNYKLWYAGFDGRRTRVGLAVSTDLSATARAGGNKWIRHKENPVLDVAEGSGWDGESVFRGSIMREENLYKMWYSGFNGRRTRIGMASSKDGINWQKALLPVFSPGADWDRLGAGYPFILKEEKTYKMWYTGFNGTILQIGYAESIDGTNWKRHSSPVLKPYKDKGQVAYPYVIKDSGKYRMYYVAYGKDAVGIETALSKDGINWERQTEKPIITENTEIMSPWVVKDSNGYKMWYSVYGEGGYEIHLATSRDGVKWEKHGAVLKPDGMIKSVSGPMVFKEEEQYKMWYEEFNGSKTSIALAFSKDGINWQRFEGHTAIDPGPKDGWDSFGVAGGWVLKEQGQGSVLPVRHRTQTGSNGQEIRYKMWYSGHDGETLRIGYAE
ncbi:MAG: hypothetical protein HZC45_06475 [Deltaproteobacteria bacterium]|nr:hypothetical protein [Deltaproteobacteria bacterium]